MRRCMIFTQVIGFLGLLACGTAEAQNEKRIWQEFSTAVRNGTMTVEKIRPLPELGDGFRPVLLGFLETIRKEAQPDDWNHPPEVIRRDSLIHYIIPLSTRYDKVPYCFILIDRETTWFFRHLETIFIRLDTVTTLPASSFPDVSEAQKAWVREEIYWSFVVINMYLPIAREKGKEYALSLLKDGGGYFVGAKTWVPFSPPHKAFILYLCWEQSNLRGNSTELVRLNDREAVVRIQSQFLALYHTAGHLKPIISVEDYRGIFETIWQDRALSAGWKLTIRYQDNHTAELHFERT